MGAVLVVLPDLGILDVLDLGVLLLEEPLLVAKEAVEVSNLVAVPAAHRLVGVRLESAFSQLVLDLLVEHEVPVEVLLLLKDLLPPDMVLDLGRSGLGRSLLRRLGLGAHLVQVSSSHFQMDGLFKA